MNVCSKRRKLRILFLLHLFTEVKWEEESIRRCVRAEGVHGQWNSSCMSLCCQFSYLDQRFSPFLSWSHAIPYQTNQQQQENKKETERKRLTWHIFRLLKQFDLITQQPGAIIGSFQYRPISHSSLHSCLNMSLLNKDQFNNRGANFTKKQAVFSLKNK